MRAYLAIIVMMSGFNVAERALASDTENIEKYSFFSQPTASRDQIIGDYEECRDLASTVQPPPAGYVYTQGMAGAAAAGFMQGLIKGAQRRHMFDAALRKCMSVKGFVRYAMPKEAAEQLYSGKWPEMREKLADRALAPAGESQRLDP